MISLAENFIRFALASGAGWLLDASIFLLLLHALRLPPQVANVISSYIGLTFVYFTSIKFAFQKYNNRRSGFLFAFWAYQLLSILTYSFAISWLARVLDGQDPVHFGPQFAGIGAKLVVTPANLSTNFLFMKFLTNFMTDIAERA